jgi:transcriptional regulator with XRE-family HTH domain
MVFSLAKEVDPPCFSVVARANLLAALSLAVTVARVTASAHLAQNLRHLREAQGLTQLQIARRAGVPRATWANLESGDANPTLAVLQKVALALQVSVEELISAPRSTTRHYPAGSLPLRKQGTVQVRKLLPDPLPGMGIERMALPARARLVGVPHHPGTREYLTCEQGEIELFVAGERWTLAPGDVVTFRGDQRHSYSNPAARGEAVGYSVILFAAGR